MVIFLRICEATCQSNIPEPGPMVFDRSPQVAHGGLTQEFVGQTIEVKPLFNSEL